jgi:hypothetical protein
MQQITFEIACIQVKTGGILPANRHPLPIFSCRATLPFKVYCSRDAPTV